MKWIVCFFLSYVSYASDLKNKPSETKTNKVVHFLQKAIYEPFEVDENKQNSLHRVAKIGDIGEIKWLVERGVDRNAKDILSYTPLHYSLFAGKKEGVELLLTEENKNSRNHLGQTPLHLAVFLGHIDLVQFLISKEVDVDAQSKSGRTALQMALKKQNPRIIKSLVEVGARLEGVNYLGQSLLHQLVLLEGEEFIKLMPIFIDKDPQSLDRVDDLGNTPLHLAVGKGSASSINLLLEYGADIKVLNHEGKSPIDEAISWENKEATKILMDKSLSDKVLKKSVDSLSLDCETSVAPK